MPTETLNVIFQTLEVHRSSFSISTVVQHTEFHRQSTLWRQVSRPRTIIIDFHDLEPVTRGFIILRIDAIGIHDPRTGIIRFPGLVTEPCVPKDRVPSRSNPKKMVVRTNSCEVIVAGFYDPCFTSESCITHVGYAWKSLRFFRHFACLVFPSFRLWKWISTFICNDSGAYSTLFELETSCFLIAIKYR